MGHGTFRNFTLTTAPGLMLALALALFAGRALAEQIILYDGRDFEDQSVTLNQSTPDLGNFDNEASSVRITSGTWVLYRNANYGETPNRPSLTLGPGDYPDLSDVGFPRNKLSSVELLGGGAPPPIIFEPPALLEVLWVRLTGLDINDGAYETAERAVSLSTYVTMSDPLAGAQLMYRAIEGPLVYDDNVKRQMLANAPWHLYRNAGASQPQPITFQISSGGGEKYVYFQIRAQTTNSSGGVAWIESLPHLDTILYAPPAAEAQTEVYNVPAGAAYLEASANGFTFIANDGPFTGCDYQAGGNGELRLNINAPPFLGPPGSLGDQVTCLFRMFGGRQLADNWSFYGRIVAEPQSCASGGVWFLNETYPENPAIQVNIVARLSYKPNPATNCLIRQWTIPIFRIRGPAGADWRDAFD